MKRVALLMVLLFLGCGCGTTVKLIQHGPFTPLNGIEARSSVGMNFKFDFCRYYEESEESVVSECFPLNQGVAIKRSSKSVVLNLWLDNREYRHDIRVVKRIKIWNPSTGKSEVTEREIYSGNDDFKAFQLQGPIVPGKAVIMSAVVYGKRNLPLLMAGDAIYYVPRGGEEISNYHREIGTIETILAKIENMY